MRVSEHWRFWACSNNIPKEQIIPFIGYHAFLMKYRVLEYLYVDAKTPVFFSNVQILPRCKELMPCRKLQLQGKVPETSISHYKI